MYAIVETSGKQYKVAPGDSLTVDRMDAEVGSTVVLDRVLLVSGDSLRVGTPLVEGSKITAKVTEHFLGEKVRTFKYVRTRRRATDARPVSSRTSSTRRSGMRLLAARTRRWSRAVREPCAACASSRAPTWRRGSRSVG